MAKGLKAAISAIDTAPRESWAAIIERLLAGGFTEDELQTELAASPRTFAKWRSGASVPREMTRRLLKRAILQWIDPRPQPSQPPWRPDREAVARIIDPEAWRNEDGYLIRKTGADDALAKADAILALPTEDRGDAK